MISPLSVMVLHEDVSCCVRAWQVLDLLTEELGRHEVTVKLDFNIWNFEKLAEAAYRESALAQAREVDLLLVAAHGNVELSDPVKGWLEQWVFSQEKRDCALVISLDRPSADSPLRFLKTIVHGSNARLFPHWAEVLGGSKAWNPEFHSTEAPASRFQVPGLSYHYRSLRGNGAALSRPCKDS